MFKSERAHVEHDRMLTMLREGKKLSDLSGDELAELADGVDYMPKFFANRSAHEIESRMRG